MRYGDKDKAIPEKVRKTLKEFENRRIKNKTEHALHLDSEGNIIETARGGKGSVSTLTSSHARSSVFTHTHPRSDEPGTLGGTFSSGDLDAFTRWPNKSFRARASEGTYNIRGKKNFDASGFSGYYNSEFKRNRQAYTSAVGALSKAAAKREISWGDYFTGARGAFNTMLVANHNSLLAGQKKYGYSYSLERND